MVNEQQQQQQSKEERSSYELIEVEDVVPKGANSLFLCVARTLIYLAYKNPPLVDVLNRRFGITADLLMSDIGLQYHIRTKLCQYFLKNGVYFDESEAVFKLKYSSFNGNVYDFLIQVYQLSINNYGANQLFNKHAIFALSRLLGMNIYCKKLNGQWRLAEHNDGNVASDATSKYLSSFTIYLRELQYTNQIGKNYRVLLPKKLWLSNRADNINISLRYTQFSDPNDFNLYQDQHFMIDSKKFIRFIVPANRELSSASQRAFCVLLHKINVAQITNRSIDEIKKTQLMSAFVGGDVAATIGRIFKHFENNQSIKNLEQFYCFLDTFVEKQGFFTRSKVDDIYLLLTKDARSNDLSAATFY